MGAVAGIGGLGLGVFLLLFRELLGKLIFPTLPPEAGVKIILTFMLYCFIVTIAGMLVWLVSLWAPERSGAAGKAGGNVSEKNGGGSPKAEGSKDPSKSTEELISLLDSRFENIVADIEAKKKEPDRLGAFKGLNDADETEKTLARLHGEVKASLRKGEEVKAHELMVEFQAKLESFYVYPITLTQKHRYVNAPEPGQDRDYDELTRAIAEVRDSIKKKYPGPEIDSFVISNTKK